MLIAFERCNVKKLDFYEKARVLCNKAFDGAGLEKPSNEVLHLGRTLGMNRAKEINASRDDATQMPGDECKDEAEKSYFSKALEFVVLAMSDFNNSQSWLVLRTLANYFPMPWTHCLFPDYHKWTQEQKCEDGEKTKAVVSMLFLVIPQLGKVLIQDGKCHNDSQSKKIALRIFFITRGNFVACAS